MKTDIQDQAFALADFQHVRNHPAIQSQANSFAVVCSRSISEILQGICSPFAPMRTLLHVPVSVISHSSHLAISIIKCKLA